MQPRELPAKWRERSKALEWATKREDLEGNGLNALAYDTEARVLAEIASDLEAALAEHGDGDLKALVRALAGLVNLKRYKDKNGKDSTYMRLQPKAWREAEETLKGHLQPEPPMSDDPHGSASEDRVS